MKVTYGIGNTVDRPITNVFGEEDVTADQLLCHFSTLFGYDMGRVEAFRNGQPLEREDIIRDSDEISISTKANTKGY